MTEPKVTRLPDATREDMLDREGDGSEAFWGYQLRQDLKDAGLMRDVVDMSDAELGLPPSLSRRRRRPLRQGL